MPFLGRFGLAAFMTYTSREGKEGALITCPTWLWIESDNLVTDGRSGNSCRFDEIYRDNMKHITYIKGNKTLCAQGLRLHWAQDVRGIGKSHIYTKL